MANDLNQVNEFLRAQLAFLALNDDLQGEPHFVAQCLAGLVRGLLSVICR